MDCMTNKAFNAPVIVALDVETTGLSPAKGGCLIEIGAVKVDVERRKTVQTFQQLIRPQLNFGKVPRKTTELTGICQADVEAAPEQEKAMLDLCRFIGNVPLVFHNEAFDWRFLEKAFSEVGFLPQNDRLDTLKMSRELHPELQKHDLATLTAAYGHPIQGHHRAIEDARYTASLYLKMRESARAGGVGYQPPSQYRFFDPSRLRVYRIKPWTSGKRQHLYVNTNAGVFCYDVNRGEWLLSEHRSENLNVPLTDCVDRILDIVGTDEAGLIERYAEKTA